MRKPQGLHNSLMFVIEPFLEKAYTNRISRQFDKRHGVPIFCKGRGVFLVFVGSVGLSTIVIALAGLRGSIYVAIPIAIVWLMLQFLLSLQFVSRPIANSMDVLTSGKAGVRKLLGRGYTRSELSESILVDFLWALVFAHGLILFSVIGGIVCNWWLLENQVPWFRMISHLFCLIGVTLLLHRLLTPIYCRIKFLVRPPLGDRSGSLLLTLAWFMTAGLIGAVLWTAFAFSILTPDGLIGPTIAAAPHGVASIVSLLVALGALLVWKLLEKVTYSTCLGMLKRSIRLRFEQP